MNCWNRIDIDSTQLDHQERLAWLRGAGLNPYLWWSEDCVDYWYVYVLDTTLQRYGLHFDPITLLFV